MVTAIDKIEPDKLKALMRSKPRLEDAAIVMGCSGPTIARFIRQEYDLTFSEFRDLHMAHTRNRLVQKALDLALEEGNAVMLIFCLKNICEWKNEGSSSTSVGDSQPVTLTQEQLKELVAYARGLKVAK